MRAFRTTLLMSAVSGLALIAGAAHAAEPDAPASEQVEELIVTAQKREQKALDVPIALTAYSGAMLDKLGVQEFDKLSAFVPGFQVQNQSPNNPGFVMRGITSDSGEATVEPRVSVFQDGVSISKSRGSYVELFDNQRIEVAKGPQSTLFGRGAMIGAVNIIQNKADPSALDWRVAGELGDHGYGLFEGMANVPLSDTFAVRFAGRYKERDGAIENVLGGKNLGSTDTGAARLSFRWTPTDKLDADLILNYEADHPTGTSFKSNTFNPTNITTGQALGDRDPNTAAGLSSGYGFEGGAPLGLKRFVQGATALVDYRFNDAWSLSSITAARHFASNEVFDPDGFSLPMFVFAEDARGTQYSQELRLNYDNGGKLSWFGGVSYFDEDAQTRVPLQFDERYALALLTGQLSKPNPQPNAVLTNTTFLAALVTGLTGGAATGATAQGIANNLGVHTEQFTNYGTTKSWDVYGDATFHVTDRFELSAGLRYTNDDKSSGVGSSVAQRSILGGVIGASASAGDAAGDPRGPGGPGRGQHPDLGRLSDPDVRPVRPADHRQRPDLDPGLHRRRPDLAPGRPLRGGRRHQPLRVLRPRPPAQGAVLGRARRADVAGQVHAGLGRDGRQLRSRRQEPPAGRRALCRGRGLFLRLRQLPDLGAGRRRRSSPPTRARPRATASRARPPGRRPASPRCSRPTATTTGASRRASATATASACRRTASSRWGPPCTPTCCAAGSASRRSTPGSPRCSSTTTTTSRPCRRTT